MAATPTKGSEMTQTILQVDSVSKSYERPKQGPLEVLADVSIRVNEGEFVSIVGPSGSGKSTLMSMIAGLEPPDSGRVVVGEATNRKLTEVCAYMPQKDLLFPWHSVVGNAALPLRIQGVSKRSAQARAESLLTTFGLDGYGDAYPFELSGGMRQRAAFLRTVAMDRPVLLLDEPFGALDYLTRTELQFWLSSMAHEQGWTVLLITHDVPEAVLLSDRVYVLSNKPATIDFELGIRLPGKRTIETLRMPEFAEFEHRLLERLTAVGQKR